MAFSSPQTWVASDLVGATDMNREVRDQFKWLGAADGIGTSLPGSPIDGHRYVYIADATNGVKWAFVYRTAASKWEFVGGPPMFKEITTSESTGSTSYVNLATTGPSIALPLAGDYDVELSADCDPGANNSFGAVRMSYEIGATSAEDADSIVWGNNGLVDSHSGNRRKTGLGAVTLTAKYKHGDATGGLSTWSNRRMRVWPVRV